MPRLKKQHDHTRRSLIIGAAGCGKTTLARMLSWEFRTIVINPIGLDWQASNIYSRKFIAQELARHTFRFTVIPDPKTPLTFPGIAAEAARMAYISGDLLAVVDELDQFCGNRGQSMPEFEQLVRYGRNKGISLLATCRRPAEIARHTTANLTHLYVFRLIEPRDVEYLRQFAGPDIAHRAQLLPKYKYIEFDIFTHRYEFGST